jgi:hypothetical protein
MRKGPRIPLDPNEAFMGGVSCAKKDELHFLWISGRSVGVGIFTYAAQLATAFNPKWAKMEMT